MATKGEHLFTAIVVKLRHLERLEEVASEMQRSWVAGTSEFNHTFASAHELVESPESEDLKSLTFSARGQERSFRISFSTEGITFVEVTGATPEDFRQLRSRVLEVVRDMEASGVFTALARGALIYRHILLAEAGAVSVIGYLGFLSGAGWMHAAFRPHTGPLGATALVALILAIPLAAARFFPVVRFQLTDHASHELKDKIKSFLYVIVVPVLIGLAVNYLSASWF